MADPIALTDEEKLRLRLACCQCGADDCFVLLDTDWDGVNGVYAAVGDLISERLEKRTAALQSEVSSLRAQLAATTHPELTP